jgi:hypothetical protein
MSALPVRGDLFLGEHARVGPPYFTGTAGGCPFSAIDHTGVADMKALIASPGHGQRGPVQALLLAVVSQVEHLALVLMMRVFLHACQRRQLHKTMIPRISYHAHFPKSRLETALERSGGGPAAEGEQPEQNHQARHHELRPLRQGRDSGGAGRQDEVV